MAYLRRTISLSLVDLCDLSEDAASQVQLAAVYTYPRRRIFKCKACQRQFSAASETSLAYRKLLVREGRVAFNRLS